MPLELTFRKLLRSCSSFYSTGAYPIMVIPFGDSIADKDKILDEIIHTGMPRSNIFFIENYTKDYHEMVKERHVTLLKILEACILRADDNIAFRWTKEKEIPWWKKWWRIANQNSVVFFFSGEIHYVPSSFVMHLVTYNIWLKVRLISNKCVMIRINVDNCEKAWTVTCNLIGKRGK